MMYDAHYQNEQAVSFFFKSTWNLCQALLINAWDERHLSKSVAVISDFHRMFGYVIESGHLFCGQYLFVVAELATLREPKINPADSVTFPQNFARGLTESKQTAIWGGASKGVIFSLLKARAGQPVRTVIDINPAKQGKYLPSTGLLVHAPSECVSYTAERFNNLCNEF